MISKQKLAENILELNIGKGIKFLLLVIALNIDEQNGNASISYKKLRKIMKYDPGHIIKLVKQCEDLGLLKVSRYSSNTNCYIITLPQTNIAYG